jgi:O-antigen/teichoic acid export membrane protein
VLRDDQRGLSVVLVSTLGLTGAAIGTAVSLVVWNVLMVLFLWRRLYLLPGILAGFQTLAARGPNIIKCHHRS